MPTNAHKAIANDVKTLYRRRPVDCTMRAERASRLLEGGPRVGGYLASSASRCASASLTSANMRFSRSTGNARFRYWRAALMSLGSAVEDALILAQYSAPRRAYVRASS